MADQFSRPGPMRDRLDASRREAGVHERTFLQACHFPSCCSLLRPSPCIPDNESRKYDINAPQQ